MRWILWIDDQPSRANQVTFPPDVMVIFAHGFEQVKYYLSLSITWELILLDHDMPLMNGWDVCVHCLIQKSYPVVIVSCNIPASDRMLTLLNEYEVPCTYCPITDPTSLRDLVYHLLANPGAIKVRKD